MVVKEFEVQVNVYNVSNDILEKFIPWKNFNFLPIELTNLF